jgi:hypothetical protein
MPCTYSWIVMVRWTADKAFAHTSFPVFIPALRSFQLSRRSGYSQVIPIIPLFSPDL